MVPQNFSGNKVKNLRGAPIFHRGDLKKCPGLLNCLNNFFKTQISLETFLFPSGSSLYFIMPKVGVREAPQQVQGIENAGKGQVGKAPDDLEMQHFKVPK